MNPKLSSGDDTKLERASPCRLKRDLFGEIRLVCGEANGNLHIERDPNAAAMWLRLVARRLARREAAALEALDGVAGVPRIIGWKNCILARSYIPGRPLSDGPPSGPDYFRAAVTILRQIRRRGITHNDSAKRANWLVGEDGAPALIDFQISWSHRRQGLLYRIMAYEDLRHILKIKAYFFPDSLTAREAEIVARKSWFARIWLIVYQRPYFFVTRRVLRWADREGRGLHGDTRATEINST